MDKNIRVAVIHEPAPYGGGLRPCQPADAIESIVRIVYRKARTEGLGVEAAIALGIGAFAAQMLVAFDRKDSDISYLVRHELERVVDEGPKVAAKIEGYPIDEPMEGEPIPVPANDDEPAARTGTEG